MYLISPPTPPPVGTYLHGELLTGSGIAHQGGPPLCDRIQPPPGAECLSPWEPEHRAPQLQSAMAQRGSITTAGEATEELSAALETGPCAPGRGGKSRGTTTPHPLYS